MTGAILAAWLDLRSQPFRTLAAIGGMIAAVIAVVLVDASATLSRDANAIHLARNYGLPLTVEISSLAGDTDPDHAAMLETTLRENGVTLLSANDTVPATVRWDGREVDSALRIVSPGYPDIRLVDLVAGAWPVATAHGQVAHAVVHAGWASMMLGIGDAEIVGQTLTYRAQDGSAFDEQTSVVRTLVIDGVVTAGDAAFPVGTAAIVIVADATPPDLRDHRAAIGWLARIHPTDVLRVQQIVEQVTDDRGQPVYTATRVDAGATLGPVLDQQAATARIVMVVALAIGGFGIFSAGLATVRERAREYGLRRAIGATRRQVFAAVIAHALLQSLCAAAIAVPVAALAVGFFAADMVLETLPPPVDASLPVGSATLGVAGAMIVGLMAAVIPAALAARTDPIVALRS